LYIGSLPSAAKVLLESPNVPPITERSFESDYHAPVMVTEVLGVLDGAATALDCTLGGGGHSHALIEAGMSVTGIDRDSEALVEASARLEPFIREGRFRPVKGDFTRVDDIAELKGESFDGVLADLGISSSQIDRDERGFSFRPGVRLDMRMSASGDSAADLLNGASREELTAIFRDYGDEPRARRLANEVLHRRESRAFDIAEDLVGAIRGAFGASAGPSDFARLFQAVRIAVNDELHGLERALPLLRDMLNPGGVMAIIAYHSGEDRIVKRAMRDWSTACTCPPRQPVCICGGVALGALITRKSVTAGASEIAHNPRARSARLRSWRKAA
jgi:16S rRNA (cytosine1402-N4)-methyltransferase